MNDLYLMGKYNLQTLDPLKDWRLGQKLFSKGKLKVSVPKIKNRGEFQEIFKRAQAQEGKKE